MSKFRSLLRSNIRDIKPYSSARDEFSGDALVFLDANENALGSATSIDCKRYPDPHHNALRLAIGAASGVAPEQIFLGSGSDEIIDLLIRAFCEPGKDQILVCPPTYGMYSVSAAINDVRVLEAPLTAEFQIEVSSIIEAVQENCKLIFICSPNNPSGNAIPLEQVRAVLDAFQGIVVVDEAYIDFCPDKSAVSLLEEFPRLVVMQTFSKAWGMAGLRVGKAFADDELIALLYRIKPPYNLGGVVQSLALEALANAEKVRAMSEEILSLREDLISGLQSIAFVEEVFPSDANFLLVRVQKPRELYRALLDRQIVVRDRSTLPGCEGCLRITVGTAEENEALLYACAELEDRI